MANSQKRSLLQPSIESMPVSASRFVRSKKRSSESPLTSKRSVSVLSEEASRKRSYEDDASAAAATSSVKRRRVEASSSGEQKSMSASSTKAPGASGDSTYLLFHPEAEFCGTVGAEEQARFEELVFSEDFDVASVQQVGLYTIKVLNYTLVANLKMLGSGSYSKVYSYFDSKNKVYLAVKFSDVDNEDDISNALLKKNCHLLRVKSVGEMREPQKGELLYTYFMELAEGTLVQFIETTLEDTKTKALLSSNLIPIFLNIGEEIRSQMLCLYDMDNQYVYTDLKPLNVLFKCVNQTNRVRFFLGDLGSAVMEPDGTYISTYPPPEHVNGVDEDGFLNLEDSVTKEQAMSWELGVFLLYLVCGNKIPEFSYLGFNHMFNMLTQDSSVYFRLYKIMEEKYGNDIASLFHSDPAQRRSIRLPLI